MYLHICLVLAQNLCICGNRSPSKKKEEHTPHLPQYEVQVRGVVTVWQDIYHCVAAQCQIRAIHAQPYPLGRISLLAWCVAKFLATNRGKPGT